MKLTRRTGLIAICVIAVGTGLVAHLGSRHTSATFDEIILIAGGVRGVQQGRWEMVTDQPPLAMYAYGLAARGAAAMRLRFELGLRAGQAALMAFRSGDRAS